VIKGWTVQLGEVRRKFQARKYQCPTIDGTRSGGPKGDFSEKKVKKHLTRPIETGRMRKNEKIEGK